MKNTSLSAHYTVPIWFVHTLGVWLIIPLFALTVGLHLLIWGPPFLSGVAVLVVIGASIIGVFVHELVHAAGFVYAGGASWRDIRFGVALRPPVLYAHCDTALRASVYRFIAALPALVLGVMPSLVGITFGIGELTLYGCIMLVTACGDFAILWAIRSVPGACLVKDHATRVGCAVVSVSEYAGPQPAVTATDSAAKVDSEISYFVTFILLAVGFAIGYFLLYPALN